MCHNKYVSSNEQQVKTIKINTINFSLKLLTQFSLPFQKLQNCVHHFSIFDID